MVWAANGDGIDDALFHSGLERPATPSMVIEHNRIRHATDDLGAVLRAISGSATAALDAIDRA
jgi:hypothetical protein